MRLNFQKIFRSESIQVYTAGGFAPFLFDMVLMKSSFGVLGHPVAHSLSPVMFEAAFFEYGIEEKYEHFDIEEKALEKFLEALRQPNSEVRGLSVTIPYKEKIMEWVDVLDEKAQIIGAVNTLVPTKTKKISGKRKVWKGFNTDWIGAAKALEEVTSLEGKRVVILGAGGAAAAIVYACVQAGARVTILNRNVKKAQELAERFNEFAKDGTLNKKKKGNESDEDLHFIPLNFGSLEEILNHPADILIHTTSIGMWPNVKNSLVPLEYFKRGMVVFDIVYNPLQTRLVKEATAAGCKIIPGYKMLLYQAEKQFELWFGKKAPVHVMEKALIKTFNEKL